jgi:hypothetical protein
MKFDVILANPPYDNGLHEKFSIKYFDICNGEICWVSPLSFLLGKKQNKKLTVHLDKYATDIESINGNEFFDAAIGGTMGIVHVDMRDRSSSYVKYDGKEYKECSQIRVYTNDELLVKFENIISPLYTKDNLNNHLKLTTPINNGRNRFLEKNSNPNWICIKTSTYGSGASDVKKPGFYALYPNTGFTIGIYKNLFKDDIQNNKHSLYFAFNNLKICNNFTNYIQTDFLRTCLIFGKNQADITIGCLLYCPWFDFSDVHFSKSPSEIDDYLFSKYNISDEIRKHIEELLPDYYGIRKDIRIE